MHSKPCPVPTDNLTPCPTVNPQQNLQPLTHTLPRDIYASGWGLLNGSYNDDDDDDVL